MKVVTNLVRDKLIWRYIQPYENTRVPSLCKLAITSL